MVNPDIFDFFRISTLFAVIFNIKIIFLGQENDFWEMKYFCVLFRITRRTFLEMRGFQNRAGPIALENHYLGFQKSRGPELLGVCPM